MQLLFQSPPNISVLYDENFLTDGISYREDSVNHLAPSVEVFSLVLARVFCFALARLISSSVVCTLVLGM